MARCVVTGGAGFIGSHIVEELVRRHHTVTVLDNFSTGKRSNLAMVADQIRIREGDIRDAQLVREIVADAEVVIHQAALRSVPKSFFNPQAYHEVNVTGTLNVLEAARQTKVQLAVFASSSSVYGDQEIYPEHEDLAVRPQSPYALTKWLGEEYCKFYSRHYSLATVCLRYFNVFGPRQDPEAQYSMAVPKFIERLLQGLPPPVHGDGRQARDYTFIEDVVQATVAAAERDGFVGEVINVACGQPHTVLELVEHLQRIIGKPIPPEFLELRPGDVRRTYADVSKAKRLLGFKPVVDFDAGLRRTVEWFQDNGSQA